MDFQNSDFVAYLTPSGSQNSRSDIPAAVSTLKNVERAASRLQAASGRQREARQNLRDTVQAARTKHTLAEIGETLGMTRQGVHDLLKR